MRFSLSNKIIFFFSLFILASMAVTIVYIYIEMEEIIKEQIVADLNSIVEASEGQVFLFFEKFKTRTVDWSSDGFIRSEFEEIIKTNDIQKIERLSEYIKAKKQIMDPGIMITDLFNFDGVVLVSSVKERVGHSESLEELNEEYRFSSAKFASFGESFVSGLVYEDEPGHSGEPMWHVSSPIISLESDGKVIGVITNHILGKEFHRILSGEFQKKEGAQTGDFFLKNRRTSEIYLVSKEKLMITPSRFIENAVLKQKVDTEPVKKCFEENQEFSGFYENYLGKKVVGASMCLTDQGLALVAEINEDELFIPLTKERYHIILLSAFGWLISIFFIYLIIRFFLNNLLIISKTALEVAKNNFNIRVKVKSKDEIGDLAKVFNQMLDSIQNYQNELKKSENALKEINFSLESKILERTVELEKLKVSLEKTVEERTAELQNKIDELEKFKQLTVGRELKMVELKEEIAKLKNNQNPQTL